MNSVERMPEEYGDFGDPSDHDNVVDALPQTSNGLSLAPTGDLALDRVPPNTVEDYGDVDLTDSVSVYFHWVSRLPKKLNYEQQQRAFRLLREDPEALASRLNTDEFKDLSDIDDNRELLENAFAESVTVRDFIQNSSLNNTDKMRKMGQYRNSKGLIMLDNIEEKLWNAHLIQSGKEGAIPHKMQEFLDNVSEHPMFIGIPISRYREVLRRYVSFNELDTLRSDTPLRTERMLGTSAGY